MRPEVVQGCDAHDRGCQRSGDTWIAHVRDVALALDVQVMNLGLEGEMKDGPKVQVAEWENRTI